MSIPLDKLSPALEEPLERARHYAEERRHATIAPEHLLYVLFDGETQLSALFAKSGVSAPHLLSSLTAKINTLPRNTLEPSRQSVASRSLRELIKKSFAEMEYRAAEAVEPIDFVLAVCAHSTDLAGDLRASGITRDTATSVQARSDSAREALNSAAEFSAPANAGGKLLARFTRDLTALARSGELMPVAGRDDEIRRVVNLAEDVDRSWHVPFGLLTPAAMTALFARRSRFHKADHRPTGQMRRHNRPENG